MHTFALLVTLIAGLGAVGAESVLPGPFPTSLTEFQLADPARNRRVEVLLVFPDGEGPLPFVAFSPGFLLSGRDYRSTGALLASHGIAVALLTYDVNLFTADHRVLAEDLRFVLRALPSAASERGVALDPERVGLAGHSLGGKLSFLVAAGEPAVRAVAGLDPVDGGAPGIDDPIRFPSAVAQIAGVAAPVLLLGAERGRLVRLGPPCAPPEMNYTQFFAQAANPTLEVTQIGAGHMDYLDNPDCGFACAVCAPGADSTRTRQAAQAYLVLFFRAHLVGDDGAVLDLRAWLEEDQKRGFVQVREK